MAMLLLLFGAWSLKVPQEMSQNILAMASAGSKLCMVFKRDAFGDSVSLGIKVL